jgi:ABC-2 type transport system permease protein
VGTLAVPAAPPSGRWAPRARKYVSVAAIAIRQALADRGALIARVALYGVLLLVFSRLWRLVADRGAVEGASHRELLWYLAVTEWVVLSVPLIHLRIDADVQRGDIACLLARPISYLGSRLAESAGDFLLRAATMAAAGFVFATLMTGGLPKDPRGLLLAVPLGLLAGWVALCFHAAIGLTSVWLKDSSPVYWIWQKCAFILGGLMLPLEVYPPWLREIAEVTPFSALMNGPGRMAFGWQPRVALLVGAQLLVWSAVATALLAWVNARARRALEVSGG